MQLTIQMYHTINAIGRPSCQIAPRRQTQYTLTHLFFFLYVFLHQKMVQSDPWTAIVNDTNCVNINGIASTNETELPQTFEDNFQPTSSDSVLPDSTEYLQSLGRHLIFIFVI